MIKNKSSAKRATKRARPAARSNKVVWFFVLSVALLASVPLLHPQSGSSGAHSRAMAQDTVPSPNCLGGCPVASEAVPSIDGQPADGTQPSVVPSEAGNLPVDTGGQQTSGGQQSGGGDIQQQIQQLIQKIQQLLGGGNCPTSAADDNQQSSDNSSYYSGGLLGRFFGNHGRGYGHWKKWGHGKRRGLWHQLKCAGNGGQQGGNQQPGSGGVPGGIPSSAPSVPDVSNVPDVPNVPNISNIPDIPSSVPNISNIPDIPSSVPDISNIPSVPALPGVGDVLSTAWAAPSTNKCSANYALTSSLGMNFGDPVCNFTKNDLSALLTQLDPSVATAWFNTVVPCESSYNPNAFAPPVGAQAQLDAGGAWGLFQMGSSTPPGSAPPAPGKNGVNDRGDVNWQMQVVNSTTTRQSSVGWSYWACARGL